MVILHLLLCALQLLGASRTFTHQEEHVFDTLFSTHNFEKITEIEERPGNFWYERKDYLDGATIPHEEFCTIYTQKAQQCLKNQMVKAHRPSWLKDPSTLDDLLTDLANPKEHFHPDLRLYLHAVVCDYMHTPNKTKFTNIKTERGIRKILHEYKQNLQKVVTPSLQKKKKWLTLPDGKFSIFDSMVMLTQGYYLCAAKESFDLWLNFSSHYDYFNGSLGVINHDNVHAEKQEELAKALSAWGISMQAYRCLCHNPTNLVTNNLVGLCQQTLGCFCNFHEEPSGKDAFTPESPKSLIFPNANALLDDGFLDIVPCFSHVPPGHDWKIAPLSFVQEDARTTHATLLRWRDQYCSAGNRFLKRYGVH